MIGVSRLFRVALLLLSLALPPPVAASIVERGIDVPTDLGGVTRLPNQIVESADGALTVSSSLPPGFKVGAFERLAGGHLLVVPSVAGSTLCGNTYGPSDIVEWDGTNCSLPFQTQIAPLPAGTRIDALLVSGGRPMVSFDAPVTLGGTTFLPSDLVAIVGSPTIFWSGSGHGVPSDSNVVAASLESDGSVVVGFDVPTTIDGRTFLPGQLVRWTLTSGAQLAWSDPGWPAGSGLRDVSLGPHSGHVPDGTLRPGEPLRLAKSGGTILFTFGAGCSPSDFDYAVYQGTIGSFTSHVPALCSTGGALSASLAPAGASLYFVVAPRSFLGEGSHGLTSDGFERPRGIASCLPQDLASPCP